MRGRVQTGPVTRSARIKAATACSVVLTATSAIVINELHGHWLWSVATAVVVAALAWVTVWLTSLGPAPDPAPTATQVIIGGTNFTVQHGNQTVQRDPFG